MSLTLIQTFHGGGGGEHNVTHQYQYGESRQYINAFNLRSSVLSTSNPTLRIQYLNTHKADYKNYQLHIILVVLLSYQCFLVKIATLLFHK